MLQICQLVEETEPNLMTQAILRGKNLILEYWTFIQYKVHPLTNSII
jgi:hypothetical protein